LARTALPRKPCAVNNAALAPLRCISALMTSVVPWLTKDAAPASSFASAKQ